jgi:hypothetical protein
MNGELSDPLSMALRLRREPPSPVAGPDIAELFLAELEARRERLQAWISLLHEQLNREQGIPVRRARSRAASRRCHRPR